MLTVTGIAVCIVLLFLMQYYTTDNLIQLAILVGMLVVIAQYSKWSIFARQMPSSHKSNMGQGNGIVGRCETLGSDVEHLGRLSSINPVLLQKTLQQVHAFRLLASKAFHTRETVEELSLIQAHVLNSLKTQSLHAKKADLQVINATVERVRYTMSRTVQSITLHLLQQTPVEKRTLHGVERLLRADGTLPVPDCTQEILYSSNHTFYVA